MPASQVTQNIEAIRGYIQQNDRELIYQMLNGLDFIKDLSVGLRRNVREVQLLNKLTVDGGIRPFNDAIDSAKGKRNWTRRTLTPRYGMKIFKVLIQQARETFQSEMLAPNAVREPFAAWQWAREFEKLHEELNNNFYLSKYHDDPEDFDAAAAYAVGDLIYFDKGDKRGAIVYECVTITTAGQSPTTHAAKWTDVDAKVIFDGPGTIIANEIAASNLSAFAGGAYDETDAYDAYIEQWNNIPEVRKGQGIVAFASYDSVQDLITDHNSRFGTGKGIGGVDLDEGKMFTLKGTGSRLKVKPCTWMGNSRRIIMTKPANFVTGIDSLSDKNSVGKIVENLHGYDAIMTFMLTFNFADLEVLYVNNQA
jgi:hypothetical protein